MCPPPRRGKSPLRREGGGGLAPLEKGGGGQASPENPKTRFRSQQGPSHPELSTDLGRAQDPRAERRRSRAAAAFPQIQQTRLSSQQGPSPPQLSTALGRAQDPRAEGRRSRAAAALPRQNPILSSDLSVRNPSALRPAWYPEEHEPQVQTEERSTAALLSPRLYYTLAAFCLRIRFQGRPV